MNRQPQMRGIRRQRQVSTKQKYQQAQQKYLNGQFTYQSHCLIQNLTDKGKRQPHMEGVQLYATLIQIAKILMLNELQILFLGATLQQMKWKIIDNCLNTYIQDFRGLKQKLKADNYNKKIQLSLLLIGYIVKVYLSQAEQTNMYDFKMRQFVDKDYDKLYQQWVQKMKKNFKFVPKNMNKLFKQMDIIKTQKQGQLDDVNYNSKVQQLFKNLIQPQVKDEYAVRSPRIQHHYPLQQIEQEEEMPSMPPPLNMVTRSQSIQSLRSLGRRDSERSQNQFGLRHFNSIIRQNSIDQG